MRLSNRSHHSKVQPQLETYLNADEFQFQRPSPLYSKYHFLFTTTLLQRSFSTIYSQAVSILTAWELFFKDLVV